jgi:CubicO group peptidase (beta-lactamase class C family)
MRWLLAALSLVLAVAPALAEARPSEDRAERVDAIFAKWDSTRTPGCALAVMKEGHIIYKRGYGMANLDHDVPIRTDTIFHVASVSKQFTNAAIVLLAQDGKLSLDDEVHQYVPELPDFGVPITIRQLVHHTSGLRDQWELLELGGWRYSRDLITDRDVLDLVARQRSLNFGPGSEYAYCNTGYTLLAQIVARVSGQSLREFTIARIFEPLGMTRTHFRDEHAEIVKGQAYGYEPRKEGGFRVSPTNFDTVGATSLLTTVEDLAAWDRNFHDGTVGGPAMIDQLHERGRLARGKELDYAFGLVHGKYRGQPTVGHGGSDAGYRSHFLRFPPQGLTIACLCNVSDSGPGVLVRRVADVYLEGVLGPAAESAKLELSEERLARRAGLYWRAERDEFLEFVVKDGELALVEDEEETRGLRVIDESRFRIDAWDIEFRFEKETSGGASARVDQLRPGRDTRRFERVERWVPSPRELQAYVGHYVSDEIEAVFRIVLEDDKLMLKRLRHDPARLRPATEDAFQTSSWTLRFQRDPDGRPSGMVLNSERVWNFELSRSES